VKTKKSQNTNTAARALVTLFLSALPLTGVRADEPAAPTPPDWAKLRLLQDFWGNRAPDLGPLPSEPGELAQAAEGPAAGGPLDPKQSATARVLYGESMTFTGTGGFGLTVSLSAVPRQSYIGYVVDAPSESYQDMVILADLSRLRPAVHEINAACADLTKSFPYAGMPMSSVPWTNDSSDSWAYWVRQAAVRGVAEGYSFDEIQATIWYITDRSGWYEDLPLLHAIGYNRNGPCKNVSLQGPVGPAAPCGAGLCGAGMLPFLPLMVASLLSIRRHAHRRG